MTRCWLSIAITPTQGGKHCNPNNNYIEDNKNPITKKAIKILICGNGSFKSIIVHVVLFWWTVAHMQLHTHNFLVNCGTSNIRHKDFCPLYKLLHQARTTPPRFWKGLDWRALVEPLPPYIWKLIELHFFRQTKIVSNF